ncbi:ArnT family glycosyltransferase [Actinomadura viridis]|uniref:4-amino-4-deoxy-L-arabinose transferase-like glycosyltransferase n=1 Tax=Actinomadura viridis TaxID=58110 RepID=A0A931DJE0_9ACTN|nr:glycosyltransferase family 39 protein [Actinomadura viridis]MBG6089668.1 4-amino-4-deoxy-L-arabinose transferase-like glycosyltransferase [Actinomadura viridis]
MTTTLPQVPATAPGGGPVRRLRGLVRVLIRGGTQDPPWARPALLALLLGTAVLYIWGLGASGWANSFYSAAVQAGATSWKAFFFGSSDAANAITVDKPPGALWPMALAGRVFGVNSWSILVPQALMGVAAVGTVYAAVRRRSGEGAALLAGATLALTPVAALMFRFNNPDALLVLLLTLGAYGMVRAQEGASTRWLVFAACCVGSGFLAKMLQAFLVVPVFAVVYLVAAPAPVRRRLWQLAAAGAALLVSAGWWVAVVAVVPASSRPYIGGSQGDSVLELALGYNGIGQLNGDEVGGLGNLDHDAGWARMFGPQIGGQISWLLPAVLVLLAAGLWATRRAPRTDPLRAALALWGGWLLISAVIFSFMRGIFHEYYTVALAPPIAVLAGMGAGLLWERRRSRSASVVLAGVVAGTAVWAYLLLGRARDWSPGLAPAVLACGLVAAVLLVAAGRLPRAVAAGAGALGAVSVLAGPAAYALETVTTPHTGAIVVAGPPTGFGPGGRGPGGMRGPGRGDGRPGGVPDGGRDGAGFAGPPPGAAQPGRGAMRPGGGQWRQGGPQGGPQGAGGTGRPGRGGGGGGGGLLNAATPGAQVTALLKAGSGSFTWVAAAVGSNNASGYQLATGLPVMAVGGFNGTDPAPTPEGFQDHVAAGRIHYFIGGGAMTGRARSGSDAAQKITAWVRENFTAVTVDGVTLYDLTARRG